MRASAVLLAALVVCSAGAARVAPGGLDPTFGRAGKVVTIFGAADNWGWLDDIVLQSDGKIVAAGGSGPFGKENFTLVRYRANGKLDPTFAGGGKARTSFAPKDDEALEVALQPDGKIVAVGGGNDGSNGYGVVARYDRSGSLDPTFGSSGSVQARIGDSAFLRSVAIQPDGKIVVAGTAFSPEQGTFEFVVGRYDADGTPDQAFGTGGWAAPLGDSSAAADIVLQADGKILVVGSRERLVEGLFQWRGLVLARYSTNGTLDPAFGTGGRVVTALGGGGEADSVVLQPDGKILVAGTTLAKSGEGVDDTGRLALVRYDTDGSLDPSFAQDGKVTSRFGRLAFAEDVALLPGGRIAVAVGSPRGFLVARYLRGGKLDRHFGRAGVAEASFGGRFDLVIALAVQSDGKLVAAGETYNSAKGNQRFAIARFITGGDVR
jgi:uncharacterized delta-60 repeat protein